MKVYLDDERRTLVHWPSEVIELLITQNVTELSLDHDLGNNDIGTGYDVLLWIEEQVALHRFKAPRIKIHSANSSARIKMQLAIENIARPSLLNNE